MAEYSFRRNLERRRRERRIKRLRILLLILSVAVLTSSGILLMLHVQSQEIRLKNMSATIMELNQRLNNQQVLIDELFSKAAFAEETESLEKPGTAEEVVQTGEAGTEQESAPTGDEEEPPVEEPVEALRKVYLTFDDGPSANTDEILDILESYDVKATFFVVGKEEAYAQDMMRQIVEAGHTLGLHSYSHDYDDIYRSVEDFEADFLKLQEYVYQVTGQKSFVYRFPGGSSNTRSKVDMQEFVDYLEDEGVEYYDWNASVGDGGSVLLDVDTLVKNATKGITTRDATIVLMHDSPEKPTTMEALPVIIEKLQAMEDTVLLPITEDTFPVHHLDETED